MVFEYVEMLNHSAVNLGMALGLVIIAKIGSDSFYSYLDRHGERKSCEYKMQEHEIP